MRVLFLLLVVPSFLASCSEPKSLAEEFPGDWQEPSAEVARTLVQNQVTGCGEFYQKPAANYSGEYMVACTRDGQTWTAWRVWTGSNDVLGPDSSAIWKLGGPPVENAD